MVDQIVNTTALSFVLTTDELILERLATKATRYIMSVLEDQELFEHNSKETDQEALDWYNRNEMSWCLGGHVIPLVPARLCWTTFLMAIFTAEYYYHNCKLTEDGSY